MSEWGRMQDVIHDEIDRQGVTDVTRIDVNGIIQAIVNVRDFFPGLLGQEDAVKKALEAHGPHGKPGCSPFID